MSIFTIITCQKTPTIPIMVDFGDPLMSKNRRGRLIDVSSLFGSDNGIKVNHTFYVFGSKVINRTLLLVSLLKNQY